MKTIKPRHILYSTLAASLLWGSMYGCKPLVNYLAFFPDSRYLIASSALPEGVEELFVTTSDAVRIHALYLPAQGSSNVLIYFHGNAGNIFHRLPALERLRGLGIHVVGVSYRGYGKSEGTPDAEAIYHYVSKTLGFKEENIIVFGRSIGSTTAVHISQHRALAGLILVTPLTSGKEQARATGMGPFALLAGDAFNNLQKMKSVQAPLLVIHGSNDRIIPYELGRRLFEHYGGEKRMLTIKAAGHNDMGSMFDETYWRGLSEFIAGSSFRPSAR